MNLINFNIGYTQSKQRMKAVIELSDFNVRDTWSNGIQKMLISQN